MPRRLLEQTTLLASIIKWTLLATLAGALVGGATAFFLHSLDASLLAIRRIPHWLLLLPLGGLLTGWLISRFSREAEGHGTEQVIAAVHERQGRIPLIVTPIKWLATVLTIATGGSAGKEGPCAQIGGSLASALSRLLWLRPEDRRKLVICGISAGFATVFGTPLAGALFGIEALFLGQLLYDVLFPSFVAAITAHQISRTLGVLHFHHTLAVVPPVTELRLLKVIAAGVVFGLAALLLIESLKWMHAAFRRLRTPVPVRTALGGLCLLGLALGVSRDYLGLGTEQILAAVHGEAVAPLAFLWKTFATCLTLGSGGSGGVITPIFFIGATLGSALAPLLHMQAATLAALGMVALLAGAANTPIAASVMAIEFFGPAIGPYACVACVTAFLISGHRSVYPSQRLGMRKSEALKVPLQEIVGEIERVELGDEAEALLARVSRLVRRQRPKREAPGERPAKLPPRE